MNLLSFVDELVKVGAMHPLYKKAEGSDDAPAGMMDHSAPPPAIELDPADATTRLPRTAHLMAAVRGGSLGGVTSPRHPIDRERFNRVYQERTS